ncbi:hypothetical protein O6H91_Y182800 [Diphasiastrum complanatum]|nr:hypothetical protein O6H91_Y182800 [Diphasiastrum complanatum]
MFSDPSLPTTPDVGGLSYLPSDYADGLGLLDSNISYLYNDWLNSEQEVGVTIPSLPVIVEGAPIQHDDFWNELLSNTPIASQLPHLKVKVADSSVNDGLFSGAPLQPHAGHEISLGSTLDMFDVGMVPHGAGVGERLGNGAAILGMQSIHALQSKDLQAARVIPSSFEPFNDTADILEDDEADFIITRGAIDGASTEEPTPLNSQLDPLLEDENKSTWQTTAAEKAACQDHTKRSSAETKRRQADQYLREQQPLPSAPASTTVKARNTHSNSASQAAKESRWAEQLLSSCASAIASRNIVRTQHLMWVLNDLASLAGDANQRLAAYGLKALFSKITGSISTASTAYHQRHPAASITPKSINNALLKFHEVNPLHQFVYTLTNALLMESLEAKPRLHVIDIGISQGTQWPTFIEAMATRSCGTPELLRLTIVDDSQGTPFRSVAPGDDPSSALKIKLERFAKVIGINLQLQIITIPLEDLTPAALSLRSDETLAICAQFRLHRLMETPTDQADDSSCGSNTKLSPRDRFLQLLHDLSPELMVLNDNDVDELATDFMTRFNTVTDHHWRFLDSMSASFKGRDCEERQTIEQELAMTLLNNVACEGCARVERNDSHAGWCVRMQASGFQAQPPSDDAAESVRLLLRKYDSNWDFLLDQNCAVLQWKQQPMTFCSVWT